MCISRSQHKLAQFASVLILGLLWHKLLQQIAGLTWTSKDQTNSVKS